MKWNTKPDNRCFSFHFLSLAGGLSIFWRAWIIECLRDLHFLVEIIGAPRIIYFFVVGKNKKYSHVYYLTLIIKKKISGFFNWGRVSESDASMNRNECFLHMYVRPH